MKQWFQKNLRYIRVIFVGIMSAAIISGIYGFMSNIQSIQVWHNHAEWIHYAVAIVDGIECNGISGYNKECDIMAAQMANSSSTHPEWKCTRFTDYSSKSLFDDIVLFRNWFIVLISFTFIYGLFSIIHDCTLIYYDNLDDISFYPSTETDFYFFYKAKNYFYEIFKRFDEIEDNDCHWWKCICFPIIIVITMILILSVIVLSGLTAAFDIFFNLFVYLFTRCCKCRSFSYTSSSWVAISRSMILISTYWIIAVATFGFNKSITSIDPTQCTCSCVYTFRELDFYKFVLVTYTLMLLSAKFLWSWFRESIHCKDYYYLIQFSLPAELTKQINKEDCTGTMMEQPLFNLNKVQSDFAEEKIDLHARNRKEFSKISFIWRAAIFLISMMCFAAGVASTLIGIVLWNNYDYPISIRVIYVFIQILMVFMMLYGIVWFFGYIQKEFNEATDPILQKLDETKDALQQYSKILYMQSK
eukprot:425344_1